MTGLLNRVSGEGQQGSAYAPSLEDGQGGHGDAELHESSVCSVAGLDERSDSSGCANGSAQAVDRPREEGQEKQARWLELEDLKQSSDKPALPTDLGAMRNLANNSARRAIAEHGAHRRRSIAIGKLLSCSAAAITATFLLLWSDHPNDGAFIGGCIAVTAGLVWAFQLLNGLLKVVRSGSWDEDENE